MSASSHRDIDDVASHWVARCDGHSWSEADQAELDAWLAESDRHQIAFLRLRRVWQESGRLQALGAGIPPGEIPRAGQWVMTPFFDQPPEPELRVRGIRRRISWAVAATAVLATTLYFFGIDLVRGNVYSTSVGAVTSIPLEDGSRITLNTATRIRVRLTSTERSVALKQGEAFFEVARDPARPFVVRAGDQRILVLGTKFSVRRDVQDVRIVVSEGAVRVDAPQASQTSEATKLTSGAVAYTDGAHLRVQQKPLSDLEDALSWRGGLLVFRNETLANAIAEFNRYTERKIEIVDPQVAELRVAGAFQSSNAEDFVHLLEQGYPLRVDTRGQKILLTKR